MRVLVDADSEAIAGHPYRVRLGLRNISGAGGATAYNASVSIGDGGEGYIFQPRQRRSFGIDAIEPGATYWTDDVILIPERSGLLDVRSSTVGGAAGETVPGGGGIVEHAPTQALDFKGYSDGTLRWKPVPGATGYEIYSVPAGGEGAFPTEQFPGTPIGEATGTEVKLAGGGGPDQWYAVSAIVGGRNVMFHPITQATLAPDKDNDGVPDDEDNCPSTANAGQADKDNDGKGDVCDDHDDTPVDDEDAPEDDDPLGKPKKDPNCKGEHELKFGPVVAVASCWTKSGSTWTATGRARIGGLDVVPSGQGKVTVDVKKLQLKSSGTVDLRAGSVTLYRKQIDVSLAAKKTFKVAEGAVINGLMVTGEWSVELNSGGVKLGITVKLPDTLGGVTGDTRVSLSNDRGLELEKLVIEIPGIQIKGKLGVKDIKLAFERTPEGKRWEGAGTMLIPKAGLTQPTVSASVVLLDGSVKEVSGAVDGLNVTIGSGVFLQKLGAGVIFDPFELFGSARVSAGPMIMGHEALSVGGELHLVFGGTDVYKLSGALEIAEAHVADGRVSYSTAGKFDFGGNVEFEKYGLGIEGGVEGWVDGTRAFNAKGDTRIMLRDLSVGGEAVLSNLGVAACRRGFGPDAGAGYHWGDSVPQFFASSCDVGPWTATRSLAHAATVGTTLPAKLPLATFAIVGADGPPRVTLTGPDGLTITTPATGGIDDGRVMLFRNPADKTTYVAVDRPAGGRWQIDELPGSTAVTQVRHANGLPDAKVTARVVRAGRRLRLRYDIRHIAGQRVEFVERMPGGRTRSLGKARGDRGTLAIRPEPGRNGKRTVIAMVSQYDLPRAELTVTSYTPPRLAGPRIARLKLAHVAASCEPPGASWRASKSYRATVRTSDGRRLLFLDLRKPALTVKGISRGDRVTVQVRADGHPSGKAPATTKTLTARR